MHIQDHSSKIYKINTNIRKSLAAFIKTTFNNEWLSMTGNEILELWKYFTYHDINFTNKYGQSCYDASLPRPVITWPQGVNLIVIKSWFIQYIHFCDKIPILKIETALGGLCIRRNVKNNCFTYDILSENANVSVATASYENQ